MYSISKISFQHHPPESTTEIALASKTDLADLRRDLHDLADLATDLANDHNLTLSRLDSLEGRLDPEMATTVRNNTDRLDDMDDKVGHFIRSLLKVKKLPSEVVALEDRIVTLDDNLAKMAAILAEVKKDEENEWTDVGKVLLRVIANSECSSHKARKWGSKCRKQALKLEKKGTQIAETEHLKMQKISLKI